jgi:hypothetical protein
MATKTVWRVYVDYGEGYGWVPVSWVGTFDTEAEAHDWINGDHDWECSVRAMEETVEVDEEEEDTSPSASITLTVTVTPHQAEVLMGLLAHSIEDDNKYYQVLQPIYEQLTEEYN